MGIRMHHPSPIARRRLSALAIVLATAALPAHGQSLSNKATEWRTWGGGKGFDRYSPAAQIRPDNLAKVTVLWVRPGVDKSIRDANPDVAASEYLRGTPIMIDGVLYASNGLGLVEAFDAETGETKWVQQPPSKRLRDVAGQSARGVEYWRSGPDERILSIRGGFLYALNAKTGQPIATFGESGRINLSRYADGQYPYVGSNGPLVVGDVIVVGGNGAGPPGVGVGDGTDVDENIPEDIRGYDVRSGKLVWTFHVMPRKGEPGYETWGGTSAETSGNMGAWAGLSADEALGVVYVPLTAPTNSFYGGHRAGDNLYSDSLVALDARTGRKKWHFQTVHHDVWDYDLASSPVLGDITVGGRRIKAVMQPSKTGFLYVFDRVSGKPVWPIVERPTPQSDVPGEHLSPTQPFPTKPPAFGPQGISEADLIDFTPELRAEALEVFRRYRSGPLFTPPSLLESGPDGTLGTLMAPSYFGGANWNTGAFDPVTGMFYAASLNTPSVAAMIKPTRKEATAPYALNLARDAAGNYLEESAFGPGPQGLPLTKPPYSRITAIDMGRGEIAWVAANGDGPLDHPALKDLHLPPLGGKSRPVALVTKTLLFVGESSAVVAGGSGENGPAKFRAFDKATGKMLSETQLPAGTTGGPISYVVRGQQRIVVPVGSKGFGAGWVALGLADSK